jgi:LytS/YehU family sensor histidine kinase
MIDNYGSVSLEIAASSAGKLLFWALIIQLVGNLFRYILGGIAKTGHSIWKIIVGSLGSFLQGYGI